MENLDIIEIIIYICIVIIKFFDIMENMDSMQTLISAVVSAIVALVTSILKNKKKGGTQWDVEEVDAAAVDVDAVRNITPKNEEVSVYEMYEPDNDEKSQG